MKNRIFSFLLLSLLLLNGCGAKDSKKYVQDIEKFLNTGSSEYFSILEIKYQLLTTPIRVNDDGSHYIDENEENYKYCKNKAQLSPFSENVFPFEEYSENYVVYEKVTFYAYEVNYTCKGFNLFKKKAKLYLIFMALPEEVKFYFADSDVEVYDNKLSDLNGYEKTEL